MDCFDTQSLPGGIRIVRAPLPGDMLGCTNGTTIWLDTDLTPTEARCTLAHELVHVELGHTTLQPPHVEERVSTIAARKLVSLDALGEHIFDCFDIAALADRLDVTLEVLIDRLKTLTDAERLVLRTRLEGDTGPEPLLEVC